MNETNSPQPVEGFSTVRMKRELQEQFQQQTAGMSFEELRSYLDQSLPSLPQEERSREENATK